MVENYKIAKFLNSNEYFKQELIEVETDRKLKIFLVNNNKIDGLDISDEMITICKQIY